MATMTIVLEADDDGGVTLTSAEVPNAVYHAGPGGCLEVVVNTLRGLIPQVLTTLR